MTAKEHAEPKATAAELAEWLRIAAGQGTRISGEKLLDVAAELTRLVEVERVLRATLRAPGINTTDQATGETYRTAIDAALSSTAAKDSEG